MPPLEQPSYRPRPRTHRPPPTTPPPTTPRATPLGSAGVHGVAAGMDLGASSQSSDGEDRRPSTFGRRPLDSRSVRDRSRRRPRASAGLGENENQQDDMLSLGSASNASFNTQDVRAGLQAAADGDEWASGGMSVPGPRLRRLVEAGLGALDSPGGMVSSSPTFTALIRNVR